MAHMVPPQPPPAGSKPGIDAEREFFFALEAHLDDGWWVYHGLEYIETSRAEEGETDFLLVHREKGLYVIECKGRGVRPRPDGTWTRTYRGHVERMHESPMEQAQDQVHDLTKALTRRVRRVWPEQRRLPFRFGHAAAFPLTAFGSELMPLGIPEALCFDEGDLDTLGAGIDAMTDLWHRKAVGKVKPLSEGDFRRFREEILAPELRLVSNLATRVASDSRALVRINREQARVIEGLLDNERLCVEGGAGTGKTVLALEAARLYAEEGARVLLLCFNRGLGNHLGKLVRGLPATAGEVDGMHFHRLCFRAHEALGRGDLVVPHGKAEAKAFWDNDAPMLLLEAVDQGVLGPWDAIVIDEAQDFAADWWPAVDTLLAGDDSHLVIFHDPSQAIFRRGDAAAEWVGADYPVYKLSRNLRNTKAIAAIVDGLSDTKMKSHRRAPEGVAPMVMPQPSPSKLKGQLDTLIKKLLTTEGFRPDQVVILTPHSLKNSALAGVTSLGGTALVDLKERRSSALTHATIGAFKGLESDVLILVDIDPTDKRCDRNARYVAVSRCRHLLYVFTRGDWLS
jgi:hypothetical protein